MSDQLQAALVITLRPVLNWESAIVASSTGTLPAVNPAQPFNPLDYQTRDRQLGYRDIVIAAAVAEVSSAITNVWHYAGPAPILQGFAPGQLPHSPGEIVTTTGTLTQLRHVLNSSIPWDAARYADSDLYGRDALIFEILARAAQAALTNPPISRIDSAGTLVSASGSVAWSLGQGVAQQIDINAALPLNQKTFKSPDQNLADRDNQMAGYVAQTAQILKNPFAFAERLYFRVDNVEPREAEVYVLISDDGTHRVWQAEPAITNQLQIHYNNTTGMLQWFGQNSDEIHVPQLYAMAITGIEPGQILTTLPQVPQVKDCQYWRQKAGQIIPDGQQLTDTDSILTWTSGADSQNCLLTPDAAMMTVPSRADFTLPDTIFPGTYRINVLVQPESHVVVLGAENISNTNGTLGGADYDIDVSSGSIAAKRYLVQGGAGVVYNGTYYNPTAVFDGINGTTAYSQFNPAIPSTVQQYSVAFQLALPPGSWNVSLEYTNLTNETTGFGVQVLYESSGGNVSNVVQDIVPLPFSGPNGTLFTSNPTQFTVLDANLFTMPVYWTYGTGQFHVRALIFDSKVITNGSYQMMALFAGSQANINVSGINHLPDTMQFVVEATGTTSADVSLVYTEAASCPLKIKQIDIQSIGTYAATPLADGFPNWRQECLDRAEAVIQQGFDAVVDIYGTNLPTFRTSGSFWNSFTNESWMGLLEVTNPRLREMDDISSIVIGRQYVVVSGAVTYDGNIYAVGQKFYGTSTGGSTVVGGGINQVGALIKSRPGHVGRPALIPFGLYIESAGTALAYYDTALAPPMFVACQPWMVDFGVYVAGDDFWMPQFFSDLPRSSLLMA